MNISQPYESKIRKRPTCLLFCTHVASLTHAFCKSEFIKREKFIHNIETTYFFVYKNPFVVALLLQLKHCPPGLLTEGLSTPHLEHLSPPRLARVLRAFKCFLDDFLCFIDLLRCAIFLCIGLYLILIFIFANISQIYESKILKRPT